VLQIHDFNRSGLHTIIGAVITSNEARAYDPGNVLIQPEDSGLAKASVVNVSQIVTLDKLRADVKIGSLRPEKMAEVEQGIRLCLGL
jgi:mRNA interferase MazF